MNKIETAQYVLSFHPHYKDKKVIKVEQTERLEVALYCEDGTVVKVAGLEAFELNKLL
jgi:hypothetical protein